MTGLDKLKNAATLIEEMTGCRFKTSIGDAFIYPDRDEYLAVNMRKESDYNAKLYRISFDVSLLTMGQPMDSDGLIRLQQEVGVAHALLSALEIEEYALTPEEMQEFNDFILELEQQREEQEQSGSPGMGLQ